MEIVLAEQLFAKPSFLKCREYPSNVCLVAVVCKQSDNRLGCSRFRDGRLLTNVKWRSHFPSGGKYFQILRKLELNVYYVVFKLFVAIEFYLRHKNSRPWCKKIAWTYLKYKDGSILKGKQVLRSLKLSWYKIDSDSFSSVMWVLWAKDETESNQQA
jgi:hypothetical protein